MNNKTASFHWLLILALALSVSSCMTLPKAKPSGYLMDYNSLEPLHGKEHTLYYEDKDAAWTKYKGIMFEEVVIKLSPDAKSKKLDPEDTKKMRNYFQRSLAKNACSRLEFRNRPGDDVIVLRTAIVDIKPVNVAANIVSRGLFYVPVDFGEAAIEGELRDSVTGRRLTAIVDRKIGGFINPKDSYTTWGSVEDAFDEWASQLANLLDRNMVRAYNNAEPLPTLK
ncbi:MAG: DUF3313 domain-containing protein [Gammaproteobacteria bacterium]|nr:MAG: DUF3313 domain-containing protein [Gammaproteobacteria bacterium]